MPPFPPNPPSIYPSLLAGGDALEEFVVPSSLGRSLPRSSVVCTTGVASVEAESTCWLGGEFLAAIGRVGLVWGYSGGRASLLSSN